MQHAGRARRIARSRAAALAVTALVALGASFSLSPIQEAATGADVPGVDVRRPLAYLLGAPLFNVLDALSLLALRQHVAVLVTLAGAFVLWRMLRARSRRGPMRRSGMELAAAVVALVSLIAVYGFGALVHRPMVALAVDDPDTLVVDFHSHTNHSHDARRSFDAERNRAWHAAAGFHAAYVADHRNWLGFAAGAAANPLRVGDGTVLLSAMEAKLHGEYASALGPAQLYRDGFKRGRFDAATLGAGASAVRGRVMILALPANLDRVVAHGEGTVGFLAVEFNDASPRGLEQGRGERQRLIALADSLDLALVAGSNHHGWGRTAAAWNLMDLPGWRHLDPAGLDARIRHVIEERRRHAVFVVERRMPFPDDGLDLALTVPVVGWHLFRTLSPWERMAWLVWTWALALVLPGVSRAMRAARTPPRRETNPIAPAGIGGT